ncbi:hypothetical protein MLD38_028776 [Melastoma candidum]|uniref:Uncharacterized protein n=1 Tax=Melastoma candidum TaxID=119954 RepID=A0ACB9N1R6_9MYRT|nr:hypothetical protein MLD38_028776 [Melastoma candidum]
MTSSSPELIALWVVSLLLVCVLLGAVRSRKSNLPPSPPALPIIGHMHLLSSLPHQAFDKLSRQYGPLILVYIGSNPCVIASSPGMAKEILKTNESCFLSRPKLSNADYLTYGSADMTFAPYGPYWKFIKKLCMTKLLGGPTLDLLRPIRAEEINNFLGRLLRKATAKESIEIWGELVRMTNNIICRMALSRKCSEDENESEEVRELVKEMTELAGKLNLSEAFWFCKKLDLQGMGKRLLDVRGKYDAMMERIISEHVDAEKMGEEKRMTDLLDMLLEIYEDKDAEIRLTRDNIKAFIMNIFVLTGYDMASSLPPPSLPNHWIEIPCRISAARCLLWLTSESSASSSLPNSSVAVNLDCITDALAVVSIWYVDA